MLTTGINKTPECLVNTGIRGDFYFLKGQKRGKLNYFYAPDEVRVCLLKALCDVKIDVASDSAVSVSEAPADDFQWDAVLCEQGNMSMTQGVRG